MQRVSLFLIVFGWGLAASQASDCHKLAADLVAMQSAQQQLLSTISQKSAAMAKTLDLHADSLSANLNQKKSVNKDEIQNRIKGLHLAAESFRKHELREQDLVDRFNLASQKVLLQVQACLKNESLAQTSAVTPDTSR